MPTTDSISSDSVDERTRVLTLNGGCNASTAFDVERGILAALNSGTKEIIFDLRGMSSVGSPFLHVLFRGLMQAKRRGGSLVLVRPNDYVWSEFEGSGLDHAFSSFPDLKNAVAFAVARSPAISRTSSEAGSHERALERVEEASSERSRLNDEHEGAQGTSRELQAKVSLQAANDEVAARERWLRWVEDANY